MKTKKMRSKSRPVVNPGFETRTAKTGKVLLSIFALLLTSNSYAQVQQEWIARYDNGGAYAIALDPAGSVYVTGSCGGFGTGADFCTIKYDLEGNQIWFARYDGPGHQTDVALAIAVDTAANVYVTGYSGGIGPGRARDYATIKYDSDGNEVWVARYDGPFHADDTPTSLAVDAAENVYVTGWSQTGPSSTDYATIKYDSDGKQVWLATYTGPGIGVDQATALAIDAAGNTYVTGSSSGGPATRDDYATIKYDSDGNQIWVARYDGPGHIGDNAHAIGLDPAGNVYVTGSSGEPNGRAAYATVKYDLDGNQLWVARYLGPGEVHVAKAIALDAKGNVYITGESTGAVHQNYATVKYDLDGNQVWATRYEGPSRGEGNDLPYRIAVDAAGGVYVTGESDTGIGIASDYATIKYDSATGEEVWQARYHGPVASSNDRSFAIALDSAGNVYVSGVSWNADPLRGDFATIKYSQSPSADSIYKLLQLKSKDEPWRGQ